MEFLTQLWLPILVAAAFVFVVSAILHMATPLHKDECRKVVDEDALRAVLGKQALAPGDYMIPRPENMKDFCSPAMMEKYRQGPVAVLTVLPPGPPRMGRSLIQWFVFSVVVGMFAGYLAWFTLGAGAAYLSVFRVTGTVAFAGYAFSTVCESIWRGRLWGTTVKYLFGGLLYALATGGAFGWLWPSA